MRYISLEWYLLHCVLHNDHSLRCVDWKRTSAAPCIHKVYTWHKVSVTSHLLTLKGYMSPLCSQQWHGSYHWLIFGRQIKWQGQLFLFTCFMSSYDRFICKNTFTSCVGICCYIVWPTFLFDCSVNIGATLRDVFWANSLPPLPPPGKKLPVCLWIYCIIQTLKYEIHNIVTSISNKNYYGAFDSTLLFSDLSFGLVSIKH